MILLLGLAVVLLTDTVQRFCPYEIPRPAVRALTVAAALGGAALWAPYPWPLFGLAAGGLAVVIPLFINAVDRHLDNR